MRFRYKLVAAFAVFALVLGLVFAVQYAFLSQEPDMDAESYSLDETFTSASLRYGPMSWVPHASKLPIMPGIAVDGDAGFYVMFVDLNATSNLTSTFPCVRVDYEFSGLRGTAAFHVYGYIQSSGGVSWTNRVEGDGASGIYVTSSPEANNLLEGAQVLTDFNHVCVEVSNVAGAKFNDFGNDTYFFKFEKVGGGLNSLHITTDPRNPSGNVTTTGSTSGTFYVDFTGDRVQDNLLLLVAVNGAIGEDFSLRLRSSAP